MPDFSNLSQPAYAISTDLGGQEINLKQLKEAVNADGTINATRTCDRIRAKKGADEIIFIFDADLTNPAQTDALTAVVAAYSYVARVQAPLKNETATLDPTVSDDSTKGYGKGSCWTNIVSGDQHGCKSASVGAADWKMLYSDPSDFTISSITGYVANEHVDHSTVSVTAGVGLSGGGTIAATRTVDLDIDGLTNEAAPLGGDSVAIYDASATAIRKTLLSNLPVNTHAHVATDVTDFDAAADARISTQKAAANGLATLDGGGKVPSSQLSVTGIEYQGTWNATTNVPTLVSATGTQGHYYTVATAGTTALDGISDWQIKDNVIFNGTAWEKIDNTDDVTSVAGKQGAVVLAAADIASGTFADARIAVTNVTQHESAINHDALTGFVANEHVDHSSVSVTAGVGLSGGGTIAATRTINLDINGLAADASPAAGTDYVATYDASATTVKKVLLSNLPVNSHNHAAADITSGTLADARIAVTNVTQHEAVLNHDALSGFVADEHVAHSSVSVTAGVGLSGGGTIAATRTIDLDINGLTADATPVAGTDYVATYDASATTSKKVLLSNLPVNSHTHIVRQGHTWAISGEAKVAVGQTDFLMPFFVSLAAGQTAKVVSCRYVLNSGTSATVKVQKNGTDVTGFTAISVTTTVGTTNPTDVTLADNDKLALVVTAVVGTPENLTFTLFLEHTV